MKRLVHYQPRFLPDGTQGLDGALAPSSQPSPHEASEMQSAVAGKSLYHRELIAGEFMRCGEDRLPSRRWAGIICTAHGGNNEECSDPSIPIKAPEALAPEQPFGPPSTAEIAPTS